MIKIFANVEHTGAATDTVAMDTQKNGMEMTKLLDDEVLDHRLVTYVTYLGQVYKQATSEDLERLAREAVSQAIMRTDESRDDYYFRVSNLFHDKVKERYDERRPSKSPL